MHDSAVRSQEMIFSAYTINLLVQHVQIWPLKILKFVNKHAKTNRQYPFIQTYTALKR